MGYDGGFANRVVWAKPRNPFSHYCYLPRRLGLLYSGHLRRPVAVVRTEASRVFSSRIRSELAVAARARYIGSARWPRAYD